MSIKNELQRLLGVRGHSINDVLDSTDSLGGGSDIFVVKVWGQGTNVLQKDKTFAEIQEAVLAGKPCFAWYLQNSETWDEINNNRQYFMLSSISAKTALFYRVNRSKAFSSIYYVNWTILFNSDETITLDTSAHISSAVSLPDKAGTKGQMLRASSSGALLEWADPPTYSLSLNGKELTLTGSDGTTSSVTLP